MASCFRAMLACAAIAGSVALVLPAAAQKSSLDLAKRTQKARDATSILSERLRSSLGAAIKSKGVAASLSHCQTLSPDLVTNASDEFGFEAERTALRLRNPEHAPDEWELKVLQLFQAKIGGGADPAKLEYAEILTTAEGDKLFRYMRPIMMADMCLACHGPDVKQDVKSEIARYYPDDKALGFKLGELRGAFSLAHLIEE